MKRLLHPLILLLIRIIGFSGTSTAKHKAIPAAPRILLLRPDHLGDLVLTTPVLDALKTYASDAHITMMVGSWSSEVVARHPALDRLITCPFPGFRRATQGKFEPYIQLFRIAQQIRRGNYDIAINLRPDFWWGSALLYLAAIPRRVGYAIHPGTPFLTHAEPFHAPEHATVSNLRLISAGLHALGRDVLDEPFTPECYPLVFIPTKSEQTWVSQRLQSAGIDADMPLIVMHTGTGAAVKLWRGEAWTNTANTLSTICSARIVLTGSAIERPMLEEIAHGITPRPLLITDATVGQLAALLKQASMVLGVDNGPLHLAVAQGTPTLQIFGPTDAHIFGPWGAAQQHIVIASTHRCPTCLVIPCGRLDFRSDELSAHPCVRLVSEQQVQAASISLLRKYSTTKDKEI
ncbi:MAG: glycosyltransferase family 9 protein [Ktedonobacteraceae bacterium]